MKICVIDLEMCQPSNRIIQIGAVIADTRTCKIVDTFNLLVNPFEEVSQEITTLTGITSEMVANAPGPARAYLQFKEFLKAGGATTLPAQWGIGDTDLLRTQVGLDWENFCFRRRAIDVKALYQAWAAFSGNSTKAGLESSMRHLGLTFVGQQHNAADDAYNTWTVLENLSRRMVLFDKIEKLVKG